MSPEFRLGKPKRIVDRDLLEFVKTLRCLACGENPPNDPHHVTTRKAGGDDIAENVIPLCRRCHSIIDTSGLGYLVHRYPLVGYWYRAVGKDYLLKKIVYRGYKL